MNDRMQTSPTFARFLAQLHATGREKLDGFDAGHFRDLSPPERDEARRLLRQALATGDAIAALGLVVLDGPAAVPALQNALLTAYATASTPRALVLGALWRLTRDSVYVDELAGLVADRATQGSLVRQTALVELENSPASPAALAALWRVVREDSDQTIRFLAAKQLLYAGGLIDDVHQRDYSQRDIVRDVVGGEGPRRTDAVHRLEQLLREG